MGIVAKLALGKWEQEITSSDWITAYIDEENNYAWILYVTPNPDGTEFVNNYLYIHKVIPKNRIKIIAKCKINKQFYQPGAKYYYAKHFLDEMKYWPVLTVGELNKRWEDHFGNHDVTTYYLYNSIKV